MTSEYGYAGRILRVDLSSGRITTTPTSDYSAKYLGGRGLAARVYWDEVPPETRPLEPENSLIFATGPMSGFPVIGGSRWTVCGKSPQDGTFSYCNLGGYWGAHLKFSGFDAIVTHGRSDRPVHLFINDGKAEIRNASHIHGRNANETREILKQEHGNSVRVVACGPAGDNMVPFAGLLADNDASGSSGFGAVMGSKGLKAIAVTGHGKVAAGRPDVFLDLTKQVRELNRGYQFRYGRQTYARTMAAYKSRLKRDICYGCTGPCIRAVYEAEDGTRGKWMCGAAQFYMRRAQSYYGKQTDVPFLATKLCDFYGLDSEIVFSIITWLSRCEKAGILNDENTGIPISKRGSLEFMQTLLSKIALRDGFGDVLAQGVHEAARTVGRGSEQLIADYNVKGGFGSVYCPRMYPAHTILYAMEPRRPIQQLHEMGVTLFEWIDHLKGRENSYLTTAAFREIARRFWGSEIAADFSTCEGKALAAAKIEDRQYAKESMVLCDWIWPFTSVPSSQDHAGDPSLESKLLSAVLGKDVSEQELYRTGERVFNLQRGILAREGRAGRANDTLPESYFTVPLEAAAENPECLAPGRNGETMSRKGSVVDRAQFEQMKDEFYKIRGWDVATGLQTAVKLKELGLKDVADALAGKGLVL